MDNILIDTLLFDFYSELLTDKQRSFFEMYYLNDLSLNEIASINKITPQGVADLLKRTHKKLELYESQLNLISHHIELQKKIKFISKEINNLNINVKQRDSLNNFLDSLLL